MSDRLHGRLRSALAGRVLPPAPATLHQRLAAITATMPDRSTPVSDRFPRPRLMLGVAAVLAGTLAFAVLGSGLDRSADPSASPEITSVDGLAVMTVGEAIAARDAGSLPDGRVAIRGFWTNYAVGHSCAPPLEMPGELEIYCHDGEYGITERDEPIWMIDLRSGQVTYTAQGPHLTPWLSNDLERIEELFGLGMINGQWYPPVPIVVLGHFDDPRAADCRPDARQLCRDRLVIDQIIQFIPEAVPMPGVTPPPTPFPSPAPSGLFEPEDCAGDVPYTFVGWTTVEDLGIDRGIEGHIWAVISRDPVDRSGEWIDGPSGQRYRHFARVICFRPEYDPFETMNYESVPGTEEIHWEDGLITSGNAPVRPRPTS